MQNVCGNFNVNGHQWKVGSFKNRSHHFAHLNLPGGGWVTLLLEKKKVPSGMFPRPDLNENFFFSIIKRQFSLLNFIQVTTSLFFDLSYDQACICKRIKSLQDITRSIGSLPDSLMTQTLTLTPSFLDCAIINLIPHTCTDGEGSRVYSHFYPFFPMKPLSLSFSARCEQRAFKE